MGECVLKGCGEEYEEKSRWTEKPSFYRKKDLLPQHSVHSFPWRLLDVSSMGIYESEHSMEVNMFRSQRRPHGWLLSSKRHSPERSKLLEPLMLKLRRSSSVSSMRKLSQSAARRSLCFEATGVDLVGCDDGKGHHAQRYEVLEPLTLDL